MGSGRSATFPRANLRRIDHGSQKVKKWEKDEVERLTKERLPSRRTAAGAVLATLILSGISF